MPRHQVCEGQDFRLTSFKMTDFVSFRDPSGRLKVKNDRVLRLLFPESVPVMREIIASPWYRAMVEQGDVVASIQLDSAEADALWPDRPDGSLVLEHPRIFFPSFPYEWTDGMLADAGRLTLRLARSLSAENMELKDGTPYNVLFDGARPVFVDIPSIQTHSDRSPIWKAEAQFIRTFSLPLLATGYFQVHLPQIFLTERDGLEPSTLYRMSSWPRRLLPPFLLLVTLPVWLGSLVKNVDSAIYRQALQMEPPRARQVLLALFRRLERSLPLPGKRKSILRSHWASYMNDIGHYSESDFKRKEEFVQKVIMATRPKTVLDIGANTGHFSRMAAEAGAKVVALERDRAAAEHIYANSVREGADILPLVVDFARPSPATGWRNLEHPSFIARAENRFELVLMLAVVHHFQVSEGIPLPEIIRLAACLCLKTMVIEFVSQADPKFRQMTRGRELLFTQHTSGNFEDIVKRHFSITQKLPLENGSRILYVCQKNS